MIVIQTLRTRVDEWTGRRALSFATSLIVPALRVLVASADVVVVEAPPTSDAEFATHSGEVGFRDAATGLRGSALGSADKSEADLTVASVLALNGRGLTVGGMF